MTETVQLLKPDDVARQLGVSRVTVYRRIWDGSLPAVRIGENGPLRVDPRELERWLEEHMVPADTEERR